VSLHTVGFLVIHRLASLSQALAFQGMSGQGTIYQTIPLKDWHVRSYVGGELLPVATG